MAKIDVSGYKTFDDITERLDEIAGVVRDKNTSLERSLDLFDEAIKLGSKAVEMVDKVDFSAKEKELLEKGPETDAPAGEPAQGEVSSDSDARKGDGDASAAEKSDAPASADD